MTLKQVKPRGINRDAETYKGKYKGLKVSISENRSNGWYYVLEGKEDAYNSLWDGLEFPTVQSAAEHIESKQYNLN